MGFRQVYWQYLIALGKQTKRSTRQKRDFFTKHEQAARRFYIQAANNVAKYIDTVNPYLVEPVREGTKIFAEDLHAENPDMRGSQLEKLPANSGDPEPGAPA